MNQYLALKKLLYSLAEPKSTSEDGRRHEFILNTLVLGALTLASTAFIQVCLSLIARGAAFNGAPPLMILGVIGFLLSLYALSRHGRPRLAAYLFIGCFTLIATVAAYAWGIGLPAAALMFALIIVMSGVLAGTRASMVVTGVVSLVMFGLAYLESQHLSHPDRTWMAQDATLGDAVGFIFIWGIIALVSWLSNREIERSLQRAHASEAALAKQRDLLEVRVEERTRELKQTQLEKILQLNRFADFGRISSGFFHDIINPLTAVSLNLEQLSNKKRSELLQQAISGIRHIENFAMAARKQVQGHNSDLHVFLPAEEIKEVISILENKARGSHVSIVRKLDNDIRLYGSPVKFHQLVSNLVANAIDAYEEADSHDRTVKVSLERQSKAIRVIVADHGIGIPREHLNIIFDPFFTTKPVDKGTGIGLLIVKRIIEEDFYGSISVKSTPGKGAVFTVELPVVVPE